MRKLLGIIVFMLLAAFPVSSPHAQTASTPLPITGTFIHWDSGGAQTQTHINAMFTEFEQNGIDTVINNFTGMIKCGGVESWSYIDNGYIGWLIDAAQAHHIKLFLGVGAIEGTDASGNVCFDPYTNTTHRQQLITYTENNITKIKNIVTSKQLDWDSNNLIAGFYIAHETSYNWWDGYMNFYRDLSRAIHTAAPNKDIMLSPYYFWNPVLYPNLGLGYDTIKTKFQTLIQDTDITIIAPQDSVGTQKVNVFSRDADHFRALHDATQQYTNRSGNQVKAWANIETFYCTNVDPCEPRYPTDFKTLRWQIRGAANNVTKMLTWIYQHSLLISPVFDNLYPDSVNNIQYDHDHFQKRVALHTEYTTKPIIVAAFQWTDTNNTFYVKGYNFGAYGSTAKFYIHYQNSSGQSRSYNTTITISKTDDTGKTYSQFSMPISTIPEFDISKPFDIALVNDKQAVSYYRSVNPDTTSDPDFPEITTVSPTPEPNPSPIFGDINLDGIVNVGDLRIIISNIFKLPVTITAADLNNNGKIDIWDYAIVLKQFGKTSN